MYSFRISRLTKNHQYKIRLRRRITQTLIFSKFPCNICMPYGSERRNIYHEKCTQVRALSICQRLKHIWNQTTEPTKATKRLKGLPVLFKIGNFTYFFVVYTFCTYFQPVFSFLTILKVHEKCLTSCYYCKEYIRIKLRCISTLIRPKV